MAVRPKPRSTRLLVVVLVSMSLATITLDYKQGESGPLAGIGHAALTLMAPMQRGVTDLFRPVGDFFVGLAHLPSLEQDNQQLRQQIANYRAAAASASSVQAENQRLKQVLALSSALSSSRPVAAQVIGTSPSNFEWTITIDKGSGSGVSLNDPVVAGPNLQGQPLLVGHVISVTSNASIVQLEIDRSSYVGAKLADSGDTGLVQGEGADDMQMSLVSPSVVPPLNELVITSGFKLGNQDSLYPSGIVVGQVSRFIPATNDLQASILVRPAVDFSELQYVAVLTKVGA